MPHSYSVPKGNGGKVVMEFVDKVYDQAPGFQVWGVLTFALLTLCVKHQHICKMRFTSFYQDIFDEESFYMFAAVFTLVSCLAAFLASRYITLKSKD